MEKETYRLSEIAARWPARKLGFLGIGLFFIAWALGGVGDGLGLYGLVPYADISLGLGFTLALVGTVLAGWGIREIGMLGIVFGVGAFYKGQDHTTHVLSGWGLGLEHTPHILLGLGLIGAATIAAGILSIRGKRRKA